MSKKWRLAQFLEIRWWKNYQKKLDENYLEGKKEYWYRVLKAVDMPLPQNENVLDVGCGPSGVYTILSNNQVVGVDPLLDKYEDEIKFFQKSNFPYAKFITSPFEDFLSDETYSTIFCLNAINHFRSLEDSIGRLSQLLQPGGKLLVGIDGHRHKFLKKIFQTVHVDLLHPVQYSLSEYVEKFEAAGLKSVKEVTFTTGNIFNYYLVEFTK